MNRAFNSNDLFAAVMNGEILRGCSACCTTGSAGAWTRPLEPRCPVPRPGGYPTVGTLNPVSQAVGKGSPARSLPLLSGKMGLKLDSPGSSTGLTQLIRSQSSARFYFELSGNSN